MSGVVGSLVGLALSGMLRPMASGFSWFQLVPGFGPDGGVGEALHLTHPADAAHIPTAWFMVAVVLGFAGLARMGLERAKARPGLERLLPDEGVTFRNLGEMLTDGLHGMVLGVIGPKETKNFFPLMASFFTYILFSNLASFIPGFLPVTDNFSSNLALGATSFLVFNYAGLSRDPVGYFKHLAGPILALAPAFLVLETLSLFIRPMSLSFRLTVNIFVDHLLQGIARDIGGGFLGTLGMILVPIPLYFLGLLVCFVQAFVFSLLSTIYVSMSLPHGDHHDDGGHGDGHGAGGHH